MKNDELRAVTTRVMELRQELESVEARLRELSGDGAGLAPIEPMDSPTILTTNHAQRRAQADRLMPIFAAAGAVLVLGGGIALGYALHPAPSAPQVITPVATNPPAPPPPMPTEAPTPVETPPTASVTPPIAPATAVASASVSPPPTASVIPARRAAAPMRTGPIDHGF